MQNDVWISRIYDLLFLQKKIQSFCNIELIFKFEYYFLAINYLYIPVNTYV